MSQSLSEEFAYLDPNFNLDRITIPKLRNILTRHAINFPWSAKKPELVRLVKLSVQPLKEEFLKAQSVERSAERIENVILRGLGKARKKLKKRENEKEKIKTD